MTPAQILALTATIIVALTIAHEVYDALRHPSRCPDCGRWMARDLALPWVRRCSSCLRAVVVEVERRRANDERAAA